MDVPRSAPAAAVADPQGCFRQVDQLEGEVTKDHAPDDRREVQRLRWRQPMSHEANTRAGCVVVPSLTSWQELATVRQRLPSASHLRPRTDECTLRGRPHPREPALSVRVSALSRIQPRHITPREPSKRPIHSRGRDAPPPPSRR